MLESFPVELKLSYRWETEKEWLRLLHLLSITLEVQHMGKLVYSKGKKRSIICRFELSIYKAEGRHDS